MRACRPLFLAASHYLGQWGRAIVVFGMLPDVFEEFFGSLTLGATQTQEREPLVNLSCGIGNRFPDGSISPQDPVMLFQTANAKISYEAYIRKLHEELMGRDHPVSNKISDALLCLAVFAESAGAARLSFLNSCLSSIRVFSVSHYFVTDIVANTPPFKHHGYAVGTLAWDRLASRCRRATSDYAELYQRELQGRIALESPEFSRNAVDFIDITLRRKLQRNSRWLELVLSYFEAIAEEHWEMMWGHLEQEQAVSVALGLGGIDSAMFRERLANNAQEVAIYLNQKNDRFGYVVPRQRSVVLAVGAKDKDQNTALLSKPTDSELGKAIAECALHLQQAVRFLRCGRFRDSALYSTIALERVFTRKSATVEAVTTRTAVLTHQVLGLPLKDCIRELVKLYEARSGFVHQGSDVSQDTAEKVLDYARHVLRKMLRLQQKSESLEKGFVKSWVAKLDAVYTSLDAGLPVDPGLVEALGIGSSAQDQPG